MKKLLTTLFMAFPVLAMAAGGGVHLDKAAIDLTDKESLKRGAESFVNYCMGCHSAEYMRYNRIGTDLGMTDTEVANKLVFTRDSAGEQTKVGALMEISMSKEFAQSSYGTKIPGLTVIARARGADWLYTYLRTFHLDDSRPTGMNNRVFADVGMPHVLWELQGLQKANFTTEKDADGNDHQVFQGMEIVTPGKMNVEEYDAFVTDLVNFMVYMGEPMQLERKSLGVYVLIFLFLFSILAYALKKEYWKDIH
jgi:ubiquinol-cytochrome c reductase cytochrome c1 subunit